MSCGLLAGGGEQQAEDRLRRRAAHHQAAARGDGQSVCERKPSSVAVGPLRGGGE